MSIAALVIACAALYAAAYATVYNRAAGHFRRATALYAARRFADAATEMRRGEKLTRRADGMLLGLLPGKGR
jgi:predicted porin